MVDAKEQLINRVAHSSLRHPDSLAFLTSLFTSCERARVVTSSVSGISTMTRSSTPKAATSRPEPGTTMPPATCSVSTVGSRELSSSDTTGIKQRTYLVRCHQEYAADLLQLAEVRQGMKSPQHHPNLCVAPRH